MANIPAASPNISPIIKKSGSVPMVRSNHLPKNIPIKMEPTNCERMADINAIA